MIVTARQLDDLHRQNGGNGQLVLPYRARLTPLAQDWVKSKRVALRYGDVGAVASAAAAPSAEAKSDACCARCAQHDGPRCSASYLWWCDGPCGPAKAALTGQEKELGLHSLDAPPGANQMIAVIKK